MEVFSMLCHSFPAKKPKNYGHENNITTKNTDSREK